VKESSVPDATLDEVATGFLITVPAQNREKAQGEVYKFIRWLGLHRRAGELGALDIASYADQVTALQAKLVKSFLTYGYKKGFTGTNLSVHLRVRKTSRKMVAASQENRQVQITKEGYAKLEARLAGLKGQRSDVTEEIRRAAADKDFRENAPLEAARDRKAHLEGRIQDLESALKATTILDRNQGTSRIEIGDAVTLCDLCSGKGLSYVLVDTREANPTKGRISVGSPMGKALLHKEVGQTIEITAPAGIFKYRVEDVQHKMPS